MAFNLYYLLSNDWYIELHKHHLEHQKEEEELLESEKKQENDN